MAQDDPVNVLLVMFGAMAVCACIVLLLKNSRRRRR